MALGIYGQPQRVEFLRGGEDVRGLVVARIGSTCRSSAPQKVSPVSLGS